MDDFCGVLEDLPDGVHWYTPGDYQNSGFLDASDRRAKSTRSETVEIFPAGSLFYIGIGATLGRVNLSLHEAGCNQQINVIVINSLAHSAEYMLHLLNSGREFIFSSSDFTTLPILNRSKTAALSVIAPPKDEQEVIAVFCADLILKIQAVQAKVGENIQSLKTLRSTLIAHAVTGKIAISANNS
jgi:restriction endonuclease S subunit